MARSRLDGTDDDKTRRRHESSTSTTHERPGETADRHESNSIYLITKFLIEPWDDNSKVNFFRP